MCNAETGARAAFLFLNTKNCHYVFIMPCGHRKSVKRYAVEIVTDEVSLQVKTKSCSVMVCKLDGLRVSVV